jgi:hypothetical protein
MEGTEGTTIVPEDQDFQICNDDCFVCPFNLSWDSFREETALPSGNKSVFEQFLSANAPIGNYP